MTSRWILHTVLVVWILSTIYVVADTDTEEELDASAITGQMPNPVGASRVFPKTSFTCKNRPAGYYADVETGCQVYHMCDGVGRQFSYACPNTTLFQQRMLICDHWYMVNCSRAEDDYAANLLIGQKDKPFVPEEEHQQRTPRPDLLDRPYAPDYSGESFRNNYKDLPPIQNHISDSLNSKHLGKPIPTRWSLKNSLKSKENSIHTNRRSDNIDHENDLGTSFSSRYNSTGQPFELANSIAPTAPEAQTSRNEAKNNYDFSDLVQQQNPITERQEPSFRPTISRKTTTISDRIEDNFTGPSQAFESRKKEKTPLGLPIESAKSDVPIPPRDLLPPFREYVVHDVATTQGPPIYYEWKTPSDSLEPPKLPGEKDSHADLPSAASEVSTASPSFSHNPFLSSLLRTKNSPSDDKPSGRSGESDVATSSESSRNSFKRLVPELPSDERIEELQRELLIPDFLFPLENEGRTGYELDDTLDSFQLKIPRKRNIKRQTRRS
ncbi:uncharacterized protein LOC119660164 isoform X2 [Hermetia illucens]|nr:uncharacterized protein LOC119660164 isoform X2 [Hermetia illucens]